MYQLYKLHNSESPAYYIGMTKQSLRARYAGHVYCANAGRKTKLYCAMRKYGASSFSMELISEFDSKNSCCDAEIAAISDAISSGDSIYNLAKGGDGGYVVTDDKRQVWIEKLKAARVGQKPALGMKHSAETKELCGAYGKLRWDIYGRYPVDVTKLSFPAARDKYGISKTHYYRLRKVESAPATLTE